MTFPNKKRIIAELFIEGKHELYLHKWWIKGIEVVKTGSDSRISGNDNQKW